MDKNIKLIINGKVCDTADKSISFAVTTQISDFNDISKRTGAFSYTIKLPRTKINKNIFGFIDEIDVANKFNRKKNFDCQLIVNDNLLLDGYYVIREIDENYFQGYITNKIGGIFSLFGNDSLQAIQSLPKIDFEGVNIPTIKQSSYSSFDFYDNATSDCLNPSLAFDFTSLVTGFKDPTKGLLYSTIDYRDYYATPLMAYSNFYIAGGDANDDGSYNPSNFQPDLDLFNNTKYLINNFSIFNFNPSLRVREVIKALFYDIGYVANIDVEELNDRDLLMPYFGDTEPKWNWLHLSKAELYTDYTNNEIDSVAKIYGQQYTKYPLLSARKLNNRYLSSNFTDFLDVIQYSDRLYSGLPYVPARKYEMATTKNINTVDILDNWNVHYTMTNGLKYDFSNNFDYNSIPVLSDVGAERDTGWIYTAPASGVYEFDLQMFHDLRIYHHKNLSNIYSPFAPVDVNKINNDNYLIDIEKQQVGSVTAGYDGSDTSSGTWMYSNYEKWFIQNMVIFVKGDDNFTDESSDLISAIKRTFNEYNTTSDEFFTQQPFNESFPSAPQSFSNNIHTNKRLQNIPSENVIAFYHPMLRDLYNGGSFSTWEQYIRNQESILVKPKKFPTTEEEKLDYFGFGEQTNILNFDNRIVSFYQTIPNTDSGGIAKYNDMVKPFSQNAQKQRKLVRTFLNSDFVVDTDNCSNVSSKYKTIWEASASGQVDFKFNTVLNKGEQVRMYYISINQLKLILDASNYNVTVPSPFNLNYGYLSICASYGDNYMDDYKVNHLKIKCVSDDVYTEKLNLAEFLPDIKKKDFIQDFIKSNNLYFDINENVITFKKRADFYKYSSQLDMTDRIDSKRINISPVDNPKVIEYGLKSSDNDDFKSSLDSLNPIGVYNFGDNIYLSKNTIDLTSQLFVSSTNIPYKLNFYKIEYNPFGARFIFKQTDPNNPVPADRDYTHILEAQYVLSLSSFNEGGSSLQKNEEAEMSYSRTARMVYQNHDVIINDTDDLTVNALVNGAHFSYIGRHISTSVSEKGILLNSNKTSFFIDTFTDLQDSSNVEYYAYIDEVLFSKLDLSKPVTIQNTLYYIQKVDAYNPLSNELTKIIFLKL